MLTYVLLSLFVLACVVLVIAVLLQPGKTDAGALFTSSVSSAAFGPRGTQTLLAKITIGAAIGFMLLAFTLSLPALSGQRSVLQSEPEATASPQAAPAANTAPQTTVSPAEAQSEGSTPANTNAAPTASPANSPQNEASPSPQQNSNGK